MLNRNRTHRRFQAGVVTSLAISILVVVSALVQAAGSIQSFF